jgi:hypothetical protein
VRLHTHTEDGLVIVTDGARYDCPPERGCWFEGPEEHKGREVRADQGTRWVFDKDEQES